MHRSLTCIDPSLRHADNQRSVDDNQRDRRSDPRRLQRAHSSPRSRPAQRPCPNARAASGFDNRVYEGKFAGLTSLAIIYRKKQGLGSFGLAVHGDF